MNFELQPVTEPGRRLVALCDAHAPDFAARAVTHDHDGSFPYENFVDLRRSGVTGAWAPVEFGGLGVESVHDYAAGFNRLGRGDGATAIGLAMHAYQIWIAARLWRAAKTDAHRAQLVRARERLERAGAGELLLASITSEPGTDLFHPLTEAVRVEGGWRVNGNKIFGTMSPAADVLMVAVRVADNAGGYRRGAAYVPRDTPGLDIKGNWDALGMRASGSHDISLTDCMLPEHAVALGGVWGESDENNLTTFLVAHMGLVASFLGIAERARDLVIEQATTRRKGISQRHPAERPAIQFEVAEIEVSLSAARAMLGRAGLSADAFFATYPPGAMPIEEARALFKDFQCTKLFVQRAAIQICDRALAVSGGAGYLSRNPLSRLYRDVRAGPFMPLSPFEALEYIGKLTLGLDPYIDR